MISGDLACSVDCLASPDAIGAALAGRIVGEIDAARVAGRPYVLGCPAGRTPLPIYRALAGKALDARHVHIVMMDEFVVEDGAGYRLIDDREHYSCIGFAKTHILPALPGAQLHHPDPRDPMAYEALIGALGGIDLFLLASGASDGHVAFNPPGSPPESVTRIVELADATRRDNLGTFPDFASIADTPTHGVSVGLGTIAFRSHAAVLILHGAGKAEAWRRVRSARGFDADWPATIIHHCRRPEIWIDAALADAVQ